MRRCGRSPITTRRGEVGCAYPVDCAEDLNAVGWRWSACGMNAEYSCLSADHEVLVGTMLYSVS